MRACPSLACLILAACSSSSSPSTSDAGATADAVAGPSVRTVTCPPGDMPTVTTTGSVLAYTPATTTISAHGIVKFAMAPDHNVVPDASQSTDAGLSVDFGATACLEFAQAGTFHFKCSVHFFTGTIVVR
jgi:plastocyanin